MRIDWRPITKEEWRDVWHRADVCIFLSREGWRIRTIKNPTTWPDVYPTYRTARAVVDGLNLNYVVGSSSPLITPYSLW